MGPFERAYRSMHFTISKADQNMLDANPDIREFIFEQLMKIEKNTVTNIVPSPNVSLMSDMWVWGPLIIALIVAIFYFK